MSQTTLPKKGYSAMNKLKLYAIARIIGSKVLKFHVYGLHLLFITTIQFRIAHMLGKYRFRVLTLPR